MAVLLDKIANASRPLVWLDDTAYSERLFRASRASWVDATALVAFRRQAAGLLRPEVTMLPVDLIVRTWLELHPELREAMATKKRTIAPLRRLLADEALREGLRQLLHALRAAFPGQPLALSLSSPRKWIEEASCEALGSGPGVPVSAEEVDAASVYIAEFLRGFGDAGVDAVLLHEAVGAEPVSGAEIAWYQPVINVAGHYRWDIGLLLPEAGRFSGAVSGLSFAIAPQALSGCVPGVATPAEFWNGGAAPRVPTGGFLFARIPADAVPERVLERLAELRGG